MVTLSRYSICSLKFWLCCICSAALDATSPFLAIISSLTRFMRTSSFSISTRTDLFTTGFDDVLACAGLALSLAGALLLPAVSAFSSTLVSSSLMTICSPSASLISDTFLTVATTLSRGSLDIMNILKSRSNFSSSMSCVDGIDLMISPSSSRFLNTRNALAAFNIQFGSICTLTPYTFMPFFPASIIACFSKSANLTSDNLAGAGVFVCCCAGAAGVSACAGAAWFPLRKSLRSLIIGSLSSVPSS